MWISLQTEPPIDKLWQADRCETLTSINLLTAPSQSTIAGLPERTLFSCDCKSETSKWISIKLKKKNPTLQRLSNWISLNFTLLSHRDFDFFLARPLENKMKWMLSKSIKNVLFYYYLRKRDSGSEPQLPFSYIRRFNDGIIDRFISAIGDENGRENCVEIQSCAFSWILSSCDECSFNSFFGQRQ